jgi:acetyltransferase
LDYKLPLVKSKTVKPDKLKDFKDDFYPIVLKGINKNVIHKTELSAVKLNIKNKKELLQKAKEIEKGFSRKGFSVEKFLIQKFVPAKHELLLGGFRNPSFGPIIMFGSGGKYVEVFNDVAIKSCYLSDDDIDDIILSTNIGKILNGVRGETSADVNELKNIIKSCAKMMIENENIVEFDLNPLIVSAEDKFVAVDVRAMSS